MKMKIPYLTTRIETDLTLTFCLAPLWWLTGLSIFMYHGTVLFVFVKLLVYLSQKNKGLELPKPSVFLFYFLLSYLLSILINIGRIPLQRIFASFNNYLMIVMGYMIIVIIRNVDTKILLDKFMKACRMLCFFSGVMGVGILLWWTMGHQIRFVAPLGKIFPFLMNLPYFYSLLSITGTVLDFFSSFDLPRLTLYSGAPTSTGGSMLCMIPLMMAYYSFHPKKKLEYSLLFLASMTVLFFSVSRSAILGFVASWLFCWVLSRGRPLVTSFILLIIGFLSCQVIFSLMDWIFHMREDSNVGRFWLYGEALKILSRENLILGIGGRLRDGFTMMAIGSHALYIEIIFVTGLLGLIFFLVFQGVTLLYWYRRKPKFSNKKAMVFWRFLGMGLIAINIWLLTDTIFALPLVAYGYFFIIGMIYSFEKIFEEELN